MRNLRILLFVAGILVLSIATNIVPISSAQSVVSFDKSTSWLGKANNVTLTIMTSKPNEVLLVGDVYNPNPGDIEPVNGTLTFFEVLHYDSYSPSTGINVYYAILQYAQQYTVRISYKPGIVNNMGVILSTFSGENPVNPIVQSGRAKGTNSVPTQSITPVSSADLMWAFTGSNNPTMQTAGQGFTLDQHRIYYGSPADEYGFGQSQITFGTSVSGLWLLIGVEIKVSQVTGQTVPVNVSPTTTAPAGTTLTVSANLAGLTFSNPASYAWTTTGSCPDFPNPPPSGSSFSYVSTASGTTTNCVFNVSVSDSVGNTGTGQSPVVTITTANPPFFDTSTSKVMIGQSSSMTFSVITTQPNEVIFVGVGFNSNYQINAPTASGLSFTPFGPSSVSGGASLSAQAYYAIAGAAQQYSITVGYVGGVKNNLGIIVATFYGENPNAPIGGSFASAASGLTSVPTVNVSPTHAGETIWAFQVNANCITQTAGSGYRFDKAAGCYGSPADEYATGVSAGTQVVSFGVSTKNWVVFAVAIQ